MKSLLFCALSLSVVAGSSAAWAADKPHHANGGHPTTHTTVHKTTVHRAPAHHATVRHTTVHRTTVHRTVATRPVTTHKKVTVHRNVTVRKNANVHGHVNVAHFHKVFRAPRRYHIRAWVAPRGFTYRRFGIGERIPAILLAADFFLADYALYGLDVPDDGYVWVRDGSDAVLVDRYTGEVIEVEYDVFY
jgi:Ni/Co efflux regulator RcnB